MDLFAQLRKKPRVVVFVIFILVAIILNFGFFKEIFSRDEFRTYAGDAVGLQYLYERAYQNLIHFKNPFAFDSKLMVPFGYSPALQDLGLSQILYFVLLRPFFSIYKTIYIGEIISLFVTEICMYQLLRELRLSRYVSFLGSLIFAFTPFIDSRIIGHFNYLQHFLFPLCSVLILKLLHQKNQKRKILISIALGLSFSLLLYANLYYLIFFILLVLVFGGFYVFLYPQRTKLRHLAFLNLQYSLVIAMSFVVGAFPLLIEIGRLFLIRDSIPEKIGVDVPVIFSSYLLSIFLPSGLNFFYHLFFHYPDRFLEIFSRLDPAEGIMYPGILSFLGVVIFIRLKNKKYLALFLTSAVFFLFSLGPFLQITRDISTINSSLTWGFPLPYLLLHSLPLVSALRSPVRFALPLAFCLAILAAGSFDLYFQTIQRKKQIICMILFLLIFFVDQTFLLPDSYSVTVPNTSYELIRNDPEPSNLLEIPFTLRDGYYYLGAGDDISFELSPLFTNKPVIGGYVGRLPVNKFSYYLKNPALFYLVTTIDTDPKIADSMMAAILKIDELDELHHKSIDIKQISDSLDFLDIKYILLEKNLPSFTGLNNTFLQVGYTNVNNVDREFVLLRRNLSRKELLVVDQPKLDGNSSFGDWGRLLDSRYRGINGSKAGVFLKTNESTYHGIVLQAKTETAADLRIVVNNDDIHDLRITGTQEYHLTTTALRVGINEIDFLPLGSSTIAIGSVKIAK